MAWIAVRDGIPIVADSGRVYFGTDTHAMTLLAGAVLATYWTQADTIAALSARQRRMASATGLASLVGLVAVFRYADQMSWGLYRGGFLWVALVRRRPHRSGRRQRHGIRPRAVDATAALGRQALLRHLPLALADLRGAPPRASTSTPAAGRSSSPGSP